MKLAADLTTLPEDERIDVMGQLAAGGQTVGFFIDDDAKADRYVAKLLERHAVRLIGRGPGVGRTVLVRIGPRLN